MPENNVRQSDGLYHISGHTFAELEGSRSKVYHGTAYKTSGGLTKKEIKMNKWGRIVSKAKSMKAKKDNRLEKSGYFAKKGEFGTIKKEVVEKCRGKSAKKCRSSAKCKYVGKTCRKR